MSVTSIIATIVILICGVVFGCMIQGNNDKEE